LKQLRACRSPRNALTPTSRAGRLDAGPLTESYDTFTSSVNHKHGDELDARLYESIMKLNKEETDYIETYNRMLKYDWFVEVKVLTPGTSFGELALIDGKPRAATIHAITDCYFAIIGREDYQKCLQKLELKAQ
jgi:CRP-like cAMP-binding protein